MALDPVAAAAVRSLGGEIAQLNRRLRALENGGRTAGLKYSSIDGGALTVTDANGTPRQVIGAQPDGTVTVVDVNAAPPAAPGAPVVAAQIGGLIAGWDGLLGGAQPLSDFLWTEVHVSAAPGFTPDPTTLKRTMSAGGVVTVAGLTPGTAYYAVLVAVNRSRNSSPPSPQSSAVPLTTTQTIPAGSITPGLLSFSAGGQTVSIGSSAPAGPAVNDLWFDTGNGNALKQWTGAAWAPYQFGTAALAAGAITTPLLAAGAVTAAQIAAGSIDATKIVAGSITASLLQTGIVVANIVNGTVVTGATLQNSSTDPRTSINPDGSITITNAAGTVVYRTGPDGTIYWYSATGTLLMTLAPGGTQLIYASPTGPYEPVTEPPSAPLVLFTATPATAITAYASPVTQASPAGAVLTVIASAAGATDVTGVTDSKGNTYSLVQSVTAVTPHMQVYQCANAAALATTDTVTVTFGAANTQQKNLIGLATTGVPTVAPLDFSQPATGTSAAPSATGTPAAYGDALLLITSWATAGGAGTFPDGWQVAAQANVSGQQWTTVAYSVNVTTAAQTATAAITSAAWAAVLVGYKNAAPGQAPTPSNATLSASTAWADEGNFSVKVTKSGTAATWGLTYPAFPVLPGAAIAVRVVVGTLNIALGNFEVGFTFWSGPNGTGSNLGAVYWAIGAVPFNVLQQYPLANGTVPAGAASAVLYATEKQADVAGQWFLIDGVHVPGGLAYSNSPVATTDQAGNDVPPGINFVGLPSLTNVLGVADPYQGLQLSGIDGQGNITGQTLAAADDVEIAGQALVGSLLPNYSLGVVTRGWVSTGGNWPSTAIGGTETSLLELDFIIPAGRQYLIQVPQATFIPTGITSNTQMIQRLRYTTDGSTPTTASAQVAGHSPGVQGVAVANSGQNLPTPYMEWLPPIPLADTTYRMLLSALIQFGQFQYATASESLEMRVTDMGNNAPVNNGVVLGTGTGGGTGAQTYTEYFYGNTTWSYWEYGQRNHNGSLYQGAYSGEGYAQYAYIQWGTGSRGNALNAVLNYAVNWVSIRLLCQHCWYNSGATASFHASTALGSTGGALTSELGWWHVKAGAFSEERLASGMWAPFKAGGTTYAVLRPPGGTLDLSYYAFFWGGGSNNSNVPRLTVNYTH